MRITCRSWPVASAAVVLLSWAVALGAQETAFPRARALSCDDIETFLKTAKLGRHPDEMTRVDRKLLANLRALNRETLQAKLGRWLSKAEIDAVIVRRDVLAGILDKHIAAKGEAAVLYDLPRVTESCGTGL